MYDARRRSRSPPDTLVFRIESLELRVATLESTYLGSYTDPSHPDQRNLVDALVIVGRGGGVLGRILGGHCVRDNYCMHTLTCYCNS